eukprot:130193-Rhodomonas_salina.1
MPGAEVAYGATRSTRKRKQVNPIAYAPATRCAEDDRLLRDDGLEEGEEEEEGEEGGKRRKRAKVEGGEEGAKDEGGKKRERRKKEGGKPAAAVQLSEFEEAGIASEKRGGSGGTEIGYAAAAAMPCACAVLRKVCGTEKGYGGARKGGDAQARVAYAKLVLAQGGGGGRGRGRTGRREGEEARERLAVE